MTAAPRTWNATESICRFGLARGDITPPVGIYHRMWGAARHEQAAGVHRPLTASVMYFGRRDTADLADDYQVLVALDHCLLRVAELDRLTQQVAREIGIPPTALEVVCSHTHAAGLMSQQRANLPGGDRIAPYLESLAETVIALVRSARQQSVESVITYGQGRCRMAANRDYWDAEQQQWVCGFHPGADADDTVTVARATDLSGRLLGTIVHYACHPTTLAWDNQLISPDFPGALREIVERDTGVPCVFLQGASGELGPREGFVGDTQVADRNGRQVGYAALAALEGLPPPATCYAYRGTVVSGATIGVWEHQSRPVEDRHRLEQWQIERGSLPLSYRGGLPTLAGLASERERLLADEADARQRGDTRQAGELRARVERTARMVARLEDLRPGGAYPFAYRIWRIGDGVWVTVQGEPYNTLQRTLRARFPAHTLMICPLAGNWGPSYLPPAELYGTGVYQETIAVLERGSLETLIEALGDRIARLLETRNEDTA